MTTVAVDVISAAEAARRLNVSVKTVTRWCQDGTLPYVGKGDSPRGHWQIDPDAVAQLAAQRRAKILASLPADVDADVQTPSAAVVESAPAQAAEPTPAPASAAGFTPDPPAADFHGIAAVERTWPALAGVSAEALLEHEQACESCWSLDDAAAHLAGDKEVA
ncbi:hypothetical protein CWT12_06605 [Actinomyces sp. 432]|uniref:helix-turn-helix domain-containing protein n=1 Tax=Actinomyces sp. 432 TaxID=2057798 RepID=UPI0013742B8A|nr:helix-turn-helix domain-containing protein [Actinomyces sp. 432]QHO91059.1 hypothetical protein CWT12_06605 [Actinomyces sp. 432]